MKSGHNFGYLEATDISKFAQSPPKFEILIFHCITYHFFFGCKKFYQARYFFFFNKLLKLNGITIVDINLLLRGNDYFSIDINCNIFKSVQKFIENFNMLFFVYSNNSICIFDLCCMAFLICTLLYDISCIWERFSKLDELSTDPLVYL